MKNKIDNFFQKGKFSISNFVNSDNVFLSHNNENEFKLDQKELADLVFVLRKMVNTFDSVLYGKINLKDEPK